MQIFIHLSWVFIPLNIRCSSGRETCTLMMTGSSLSLAPDHLHADPSGVVDTGTSPAVPVPTAVLLAGHVLSRWATVLTRWSTAKIRAGLPWTTARLRHHQNPVNHHSTTSTTITSHRDETTYQSRASDRVEIASHSSSLASSACRNHSTDRGDPVFLAMDRWPSGEKAAANSRRTRMKVKRIPAQNQRPRKKLFRYTGCFLFLTTHGFTSSFP